MKLSAKQIKTYATVILMSVLPFQASAIISEKGENPDAWMEAGFIEIEEISLESWMVSPFKVEMDEVSDIEMPVAPAPEIEFEAELALESWMAIPFELNVSETTPIGNPICSPAP